MRSTIWICAATLALALGCGAKDESPAEPAEPATPDPAVEDAHSDEVSARIKTGKVDVRNCGNEENAGGEIVSGRVSVTFKIEADGSVSGVSMEENPTGKQEVADCVVKVIQGWSFPAHPYDESIEYTYPFQVGP